MKTILLYSKEQYFKYKDQEIQNDSIFLNMTELLNSQKIEELDDKMEYLVDMSSVVGYIRENDSQIFNFEQLLKSFKDNVRFIADIKYKKDILYTLRYFFDNSQDIKVDISDSEDGIESKSSDVKFKKTVKRIIDLEESTMSIFFNNFNSKLYGHDKFKEEFRKIVTTYRVFNRIGEHKVLSLFLMGDSGVGKTEVARCIHKCLSSKSKLAKINFGNYSSHDALNSLIGSPRGYIGSDDGELMKRVSESDIGLILIDEFEKADTPVFNYFLDVLENGKLLSSQGEEYDINGYIIVFTSNISKEDFQKRISPELRSRFDYKGIFNLLTDEDKSKFVKYRVNDIIGKYNKLGSRKISDQLFKKVVAKINVTKYKNMRELNKNIKDVFVSEIQKIET